VVITDKAAVARRMAGGWLKSATHLTEWPDPIPDELWTWSLELAAIAYRNPDGVLSEGIDDYNSTLDRARRAQILADARAVYGGASGPQYSFPAPDWQWEAVPATDPLTD
jgi:hypothetical protein